MYQFLQELFSVKLYKNSQGRIVRKLTMLAIAVLFASGAFKLYQMPFENIPVLANDLTRACFAGFIALLGLWVGFRATHFPVFANFLISVESEMIKVSWPSPQEVYSSTIVVLVMFCILSAMIYLFDLLWVFAFNWLKITS